MELHVSLYHLSQGIPYRRTFDTVMWRCVQAGLTQKWLLDVNKLYWMEAQAAKSEEQRKREAEAGAAVREDGLVSRDPIKCKNHVWYALLNQINQIRNLSAN